MNIKNNNQPKGLNELVGKRKEPFNPFQREALFPREVLQPLYDKWRREIATGNNADEFYQFLLRQCK